MTPEGMTHAEPHSLFRVFPYFALSRLKIAQRDSRSYLVKVTLLSPRGRSGS